MKWYFGMNDNGVLHYERMIKSAVLSNEKTNNFEVNVIYSGARNNITDWLQNQGAVIHWRDVSFEEDLRNGAQRKHYFDANVACGAYLRVEIPLHELDDDYVLYTDADVIFLRKLDLSYIKPTYFACSDEVFIRDSMFHFVPSAFNSGVMLMNTKMLRDDYDNFLIFMRNNNFDFNAYDQGALNEFYSGRWEKLRRELNWRPFLGINPGAYILHFHGPKPNDIKMMLDHGKMINTTYESLFAVNPEAYRYYYNLYCEMENALYN